MKGKKENIEEQIKKIKLIVDQYLDPKAKQRLRFVELSHPNNALQAYLFLFQLIQTGRINRKITEEEIKKILLEIARRNKPNYKIIFK